MDCDRCLQEVTIELDLGIDDVDTFVTAELERRGWDAHDEDGDICPDCLNLLECEECGLPAENTEHCQGCSMALCSSCHGRHQDDCCGNDDDEEVERPRLRAQPQE